MPIWPVLLLGAIAGLLSSLGRDDVVIPAVGAAYETIGPGRVAPWLTDHELDGLQAEGPIRRDGKARTKKAA